VSTPNLNVLLSASLATYDNTQPNTPLLSMLSAGNPTFGATTYFYNEFLQAGIIGASVTLYVTPSYVCWIRNRSTTVNLQVSINYVAFGNSQFSLGPGDLFVYDAASKAIGGFTGLTLIGLLGTCPVEVYVAG
jgi:hypothetical protein